MPSHSRALDTADRSMSPIDGYLARFAELDGHEPAWLHRQRKEAIARFASLGFPTTHLEDWKYTSVTALSAVPFDAAAPDTVTPRERRAADGLRLGAGIDFVFVNGFHVPALSAPAALPAGVTVTSLARAATEHADLVRAHLGRYADDEQAFTALNTAFARDGAFVHLRRGVALPGPLHLVFLSAAAPAPVMTSPRTLIVAEEDSAATIIESYAGPGDVTYFTNAVTEIAVGPRAALTHYRLQEEGARAFHVAAVRARQDADSRFTSLAVSLGATLSRTDLGTTMDAEGTSCVFDGLYLAGGDQHVDHHTSIDHRQPHGTSRELYKGILDGRATGVFNGKVYVRPQAQKSDAQQMNKNLLLSDDAVINTKPQLEIFADDVKCSHGATIGRLSDDALFYLRARGIDARTARQLLIHAFARELIDRVGIASLRERLDRALQRRLPHLDEEGAA